MGNLLKLRINLVVVGYLLLALAISLSKPEARIGFAVAAVLVFGLNILLDRRNK
jgi:hypothetical protein